MRRTRVRCGRWLARPLSRAALLAGVAMGDFDYEARPQQVEMARAVADALESSRHLVVEAGTGVGKSLAYLVPLILHAKRDEQAGDGLDAYDFAAGTAGRQGSAAAEGSPGARRSAPCW